MKYKDIAKKYGVSINTVKSWKQRYKWSKDKNSVHTKGKNVCTQKNNEKDNIKNTQEVNKESDNNNYLEVEELTEKQKIARENFIQRARNKEFTKKQFKQEKMA